MRLSELIHGLSHIRTHYGRAPRSARRRLLEAAPRCVISSGIELVSYHELLLFICAFPDDRGILRLANAELRRVASAARTLSSSGRQRDRRVLSDTGIAGSISHVSFSVQTAAWLARRFPRDTEIAWDDGSAGGLDTMLGTLVERAEIDGLDDTTLSTREWLALARGGSGSKRKSDLAWLLDHFHRLALPPRALDAVFDLLELEIRWALRDPLASRTLARFPRRAVHYQATPLQRTAPGQIEVPRARPSARREAVGLIDLARSVLAARGRETDPVTHAEPADVTLFNLEHGIDVALYGLVAKQRLPLYTYYGYVLAKNRVPMAYGGGWVFFGHCEIGINVFDTFRGGESARAFAALLALYRQHFNITRFTVDPYQIGAGNPEAIKSGAIWFYYRFGFRPQDPQLAAVAEREWQRMHPGTGYRSSPRVLRRLAEGPLELKLAAGNDRLTPGRLGLAVTAWIGGRFHGERDAARRWAIAHVSAALSARSRRGWRAAESEAFDDMCLLLAPLAQLDEWPRDDKQRLVALMRAKGGLRERRFALALQRHPRLYQAWSQLAEQG